MQSKLSTYLVTSYAPAARALTAAVVLSLSGVAYANNNATAERKSNETAQVTIESIVSSDIGSGVSTSVSTSNRALEELRNLDLPAVVLRASEISSNAGGSSRNVMTLNTLSSNTAVVKDKPYSADVSYETQRKLGDGNLIANSSKQRVYRNSAGHTRTESFDKNGVLTSVQLSLGAEGRFTLVPTTKTAFKSKGFAYDFSTANDVPSNLGNMDCSTEKSGNATITRCASEKTVTMNMSNAASAAPKSVRVSMNGKDIEVNGNAVQTSDGKRVKVITTTSTEDLRQAITEGRLMGGNAAGVIASDVSEKLLRSLGSNGELAKLNGQNLELLAAQAGNSKSLGTKTMAGVAVEGTGTEKVTPAGAIGNAQPIISTSERWFSKDLDIVVMRKSDSPLNGSTTYQLTNIVRAEPNAELFKVPADYTTR
jgi:hypothetical protein